MTIDDFRPQLGSGASSDLSGAVRGAASKASSEFERLYAGAVPALIAWTRLRIATLPHGRIDVEDVVQETWLRALANFARFIEGESFRYWVIGIAQNVLLEALRRDMRQRKQPLHSDGQSHLSQCPDSVTSISRAAARDDGFVRLLAVIVELSEEERLLLLLHGLEGRPFERVAARLAINEEAVRKRWQRLRARLQEQPAFVEFLQG